MISKFYLIISQKISQQCICPVNVPPSYLLSLYYMYKRQSRAKGRVILWCFNYTYMQILFLVIASLVRHNTNFGIRFQLQSGYEAQVITYQLSLKLLDLDSSYKFFCSFSNAYFLSSTRHDQCRVKPVYTFMQAYMYVYIVTWVT